jgi:hypothetical protein
MWTPWQGSGLEHLRLALNEAAVNADGLIIGMYESQVFRLHYQIRCDASWFVREVRLSLFAPEEARLHLWADGQGHWKTEGGRPAPALDGCLDIDLSATAFTNTLPIRRLGLQPGGAAELEIAYIDVPALVVTTVRQRYTCLKRGPEGGTYRYESLPYEALPTSFTAELPVDPDGLVIDYPGLFRRAWSG